MPRLSATGVTWLIFLPLHHGDYSLQSGVKAPHASASVGQCFELIQSSMCDVMDQRLERRFKLRFETLMNFRTSDPQFGATERPAEPDESFSACLRTVTVIKGYRDDHRFG